MLTDDQVHWLYHKLRALGRVLLCRISLPNPSSCAFDDLVSAVEAEFDRRDTVRGMLTGVVTMGKGLALVNKWLSGGVITAATARAFAARLHKEHELTTAKPALVPVGPAEVVQRKRKRTTGPPARRNAAIEQVTMLGDHPTYIEKALHTTVICFVATTKCSRGVRFQFIERMEKVTGCVVGKRRVRVKLPPGVIDAMIESTARELIRLVRRVFALTSGAYDEVDTFFSQTPDWKSSCEALTAWENSRPKEPKRLRKITKKELAEAAKKEAVVSRTQMQRKFLEAMVSGKKKKRVDPPPGVVKRGVGPPVMKRRDRLDPMAVRGVMEDELPRNKLVFSVLSMVAHHDDIFHDNLLGWHGYLASSEIFDDAVKTAQKLDVAVGKALAGATYEAKTLLTISIIERLDAWVGQFCRLAALASGDVVANCDVKTWGKAVTMVSPQS